jgi:hypothetical protein
MSKEDILAEDFQFYRKIEKLFLMYDLFYYGDKSWNPANGIGGEKNTPKENLYKELNAP